MYWLNRQAPTISTSEIMYGVVCYISLQNDKTEMLQWQYVMYKEDQDDTYAKGNYLHFAIASQHCVTYVWPCSRTTARCLAALSLARASFCRLLSAAGNQISNKMQHWTCTECTVEIKQCDADDLVLHHARRSILVSLLPTAPAHGIPCHGLKFFFL